MKIMVFSEHFFPAYQGGGIIQSLRGLVFTVSNIEFFIVSSARDLGCSSTLDNIEFNKWNYYSEACKVYYLTNGFLIRSYRGFINQINPDLIYVNGIFSIRYNLLPILMSKLLKRKLIIAPRGMLQTGALSIKGTKKKLYLCFIKLLRLYPTRWHATDEQESIDIKKIFGSKVNVFIANDTPLRLPPKPKSDQFVKDKNNLKLVYLSLISTKKNVHIALKALLRIKTPVQFHIYGPIKDVNYWNSIQYLLSGQIHEIKYLGAVHPQHVTATIASYDVMILPTSGENFGHVIYESLSVGIPIIVSRFTPWSQDEHDALTIVDGMNENDWAKAIDRFIAMDNQEYSRHSQAAIRLAKSYLEKYDLHEQYKTLFSF